MTVEERDELTIQGLREVGEKARRSRKFARQFLIDAGIIPDLIPDFFREEEKRKKKVKKKK